MQSTHSKRICCSLPFLLIVLLSCGDATAQVSSGYTSVQESQSDKPRARDLGIEPGILNPGPLNAITDVKGVLVGHVTLMQGMNVRTGVTAILPHRGNIYREKVPAGIAVGNGYGKFAGTTQIIELGEIETPIVLTNTLSVARGIEGVIEWTLVQPGNENVRSVNAVVGETNDGFLNDIRGRHVSAQDVVLAIESASAGPVEEGAVGAGTGTVAFGWKGGMGTSSRVLPASLGGYVVGAVVQTNYGGILQIDGVPVGEEMDQYFLKRAVDAGDADGSIIIVIATDAPLSDRNLTRLARRGLSAIARSGSPATNGSGDYAIAFSTAPSVRRSESRGRARPIEDLPNAAMSPLFEAAMESTEEAIYNSLLKATTMQGFNGTVRELPVEDLKRILAKYGR